MILSMPIYPLSPDPKDVIAAMEADHQNMMFADVHVRGGISGIYETISQRAWY